MYAAKRAHVGYAMYQTGQDADSRRQVALAGALRQAIEHDQLILHYQPKVDFDTGQATGAEALVRWQHPEYGLVHPDEFIPLAEHTGFIMPLTRWVLNEALHQCRHWKDDGLNVPVGINLSARSLHDQTLLELIDETLHSWNLPASCLGVEITESSIMADPQRALDILTGLHDMGVAISIDDFGTGYSSLAYLKRLPASEVKIDKSFVLPIARDTSDWRIVRATISLAHDLDLKAVAEGVESREAWDLLSQLHCDLAQGYYLSHPMPGNQYPQWLAGTGKSG
jgi:EAL domain-containing protein (putative c-di-GMP-specific phosphodiesterase class I)